MSVDHFTGRCLVSAAALWLASWIVPEVEMTVPAAAWIGTLLIFALMHEVIRPVLSFITCSLVLVLVIPARIAVQMLILSATVAGSGVLGSSLAIEGIATLLWMAIAVGVIRLLLTEFARLHEVRGTIRKQRLWIEELRQAKSWLAEQVRNWQTIAKERQRVLHEQRAWIEELQAAKTWLTGQIARHSVNVSE
jgi:uncharacterized membrane protein YvlD (DUF360 family)